MSHINVMQALEREAGGVTKAAALVGVSQQVWVNWRVRGPSPHGELLIWLASRSDGRRLLRGYLRLKKGDTDVTNQRAA